MDLFICIKKNPRDPITLSMIGVYNHLLNARYLGSIKPFSVSVIGSLGVKYIQYNLPPWKLTYPLKNDGWKMNFLLK